MLRNPSMPNFRLLFVKNFLFLHNLQDKSYHGASKNKNNTFLLELLNARGPSGEYKKLFPDPLGMTVMRTWHDSDEDLA